jgi:DNA-binding response OmpR family regulator
VVGSVSALRGRTVLIVEDEPLLALDIAEEVSANGAQAVVANGVQEALSALSRVRFAIAIVDHRLRGEDAAQVIRRLKDLQTPLVIYTGYDVVAASAGAPVVHKPATTQHLMQTVCDLLG